MKLGKEKKVRKDSIQIGKMITILIIEESHFLDEKLIDDIPGNDYKEVVNQNQEIDYKDSR